MRRSASDELALLPRHGVGDRVSLAFRAVEEPRPGKRWQAEFETMWPAYRAWYLQDGEAARPDLQTCRAMLARWMPELVATFERLVDLAGGDELAARCLSMYNPPPFVVGCSQAAFTGPGGPVLVRNYDYQPERVEALIYSTAWTHRRVIGMSDSLWGLLDGVNDAGLAVSLTFGGRRAVGEGFGIPLVMRYVLEVCANVEDGCKVLSQIPVHAPQNITLLDRSGDFATVYVAPDRPAELLSVAVATNHQRTDDWPEYAAAVASLERERRLEELAHRPRMTSHQLVHDFLEPPLYRRAYASGFGTLYTAAYYPALGRVEYHWPDHVVTQTFGRFVEQRHEVRYEVAG